MSSPALTSVELAVLSDYSSQISEFVPLDRILPRLKNLECLSLYRADMESMYSDAHRVEECRFAELFPQLHGSVWLSTPLGHAQIKALTLGSREFKDEWPSRIWPWLMGTDWSLLTYLDIQNSVHRVVLRTLTGRTPCLRTLKLGGAQDVYGVFKPSPINDYLRDFLSTTSLLTELSIANSQYPAWKYYVDTVLSSTGRHLNQFVVEPGDRYAHGSTTCWSIPEIEGLQIKASNLRLLPSTFASRGIA